MNLIINEIDIYIIYISEKDIGIKAPITPPPFLKINLQ